MLKIFALIFYSGEDYAFFSAIWDKFALNLKFEDYAETAPLIVLFGTNLESNISTKA